MIPGRGCITGIVILAVGLGGLGDVTDVVARHWTTSQIEKRIRATVPQAQGVHAHIRSFPFLKVLVNGHVDEMGGHIDHLTVARLTFDDIDVEIHGLRIKQGDLISNRKVVVTHIDTGTVSATLTAASLTQAFGVPVGVAANSLVASGVAVGVSVRSSRQVVITVAGIGARSFPLPDASLLPCLPSVAFAHQAMVLSCSFDHVPSAFTSFG